MTVIFAKNACLASGWAHNVRVVINDGRISKIETGVVAGRDDTCVNTLLPALANVHSHSFQRAMAGQTEYRAAGQDSFWTWRDLMYRFVRQLNPDHIQAFAAQTFMEMQEAGFASVGEFHYVHHQPDGTPYDDIAELSMRIFAAADQSGIGLTHLPVLYSYGGAAAAPLGAGQARFGNSVDRFQRLADATRAGLAGLPADAQIGVAPHSLRATNPADLKVLLSAHPTGPVHIHIAEQPKEVADIAGWLGARPVAWLLQNAAVDRRWCLIHATHMTPAETENLAATGAVAGLCPITESNLGDGIFNARDYLNAGGAFAIGSDSNVRISLSEELRTLEYSQRLRDMGRNVLVVGGDGSVGQSLYLGAAAGGAQALGRPAGRIAIGRLADLVAIDSNASSLCALRPSQLLDGWVFAADDRLVTDLWSAGRHMVRGGHHIHKDAILAGFKKSIRHLTAQI